MTASIFIRTYRGDREWLTYSLRALNKYASGFTEIVVVLPRGDEPHFDRYDFQGARVVWVDDIPGDGYMGQQVCKLEADLVTTSDYVMFVDADCIAKRKFYLAEFLLHAKPIQLVRFWETFVDDPDAYRWKGTVTRALKEQPKLEHMAVMPLIYWRDSITNCREYLNGLHGSMRNYVQRCANRDFSEFNTLGAFCHMYEPHRYEWRMAGAEDGYPRPIRQYQSREGVEMHKASFNL